MGEVTKIAVDLIRRRADARPLYDGAVADLEDSIRDIGLTTPLTVRPLDEGAFELIAGNHRFAACDGLGWPEVDCIVVDDDDLTAELRMIDENLMRAELTPSERARQTARRKAIYEELHPETRHGENQHTRVRQVGDSSSAERFTAETATSSGRSERAVQRDVERGTKVCADALAIVQGTKLDTGSYLDKLKRLSPNDQVHAARRDLTISNKADRAEANARAEAPTAPTPEPVRPKVDPFATWLDLAEKASRLDAEAIFDACPVRQRPALAQRCEAVRAVIDEIADLIERPNVRRPAR